jgi:hypothetical protein
MAGMDLLLGEVPRKSTLPKYPDQKTSKSWHKKTSKSWHQKPSKSWQKKSL